ncbi:hypothetical protein BB559_003363 [Furculomyces boomerangus]|uniref:Arsenite methyltransferase n=2 Tax=Harpellales TaxID=61421 RepID=A0A2T9YLR6_9FUNG|nr:hypothetical protein BB559_003363 [Furculomyces boomerangus]PWA00419.1 hypothetical protein BB558_003518 [Smittium angustum]
MAPKHFAPVWKHFERKVPIGKSKHHRAQCVYCDYELSGQPERMKSHLKKCPKIPRKTRESIINELVEAGEYENNTPNRNNHFPDSEHIDFPHHNNPSSKHLYNHKEDYSNYSEPHSPSDHSTKRTAEIEDSEFKYTRDRSRDIEKNNTNLDEHSGYTPAEKRYKNNISLPGSVQGLLGLPWDRTGRSVMAFSNNDWSDSCKGAALLGSIRYKESSSGYNKNKSHNSSSNKANDDPHENSEIYKSIRNYYSKTMSTQRKQVTTANKIAPHPIIKEAISLVPLPVNEKYFGCGTPIPMGIEGLRVLDLGCGSGRDCYVVSKLVGHTGEVTGIDMTDELLDIARNNIDEYANILGYRPHLNFVKGYIEFLNDAGLYPETIDLCISNNAVNLSPNKELVFQSVFNILREGGEFYFSDIYADRRLPNHLRSHPTLVTECLGGALYTEDFKRLCQRVGFVDPRQVGPAVPVRVESPELRDLVRATQFYSITYRMFKHSKPTTILEPTREDYGQVAIYRGSVEGQRARLRLDNEWCFEANRSVLVDGNTAVILSESWLQRHFDVRGDRSNHFGSFKSSNNSNSQYDSWELENDEYIFYNNLLNNKPISGPGINTDTNFFLSGGYGPSYSGFGANNSNANSIIFGNSIQNNTNTANETGNNAGFFTGFSPPLSFPEQQNFLSPLANTDLDPTPTFNISAGKVATSTALTPIVSSSNFYKAKSNINSSGSKNNLAINTTGSSSLQNSSNVTISTNTSSISNVYPNRSLRPPINMYNNTSPFFGSSTNINKFGSEQSKNGNFGKDSRQEASLDIQKINDKEEYNTEDQEHKHYSNESVARNKSFHSIIDHQPSKEHKNHQYYPNNPKHNDGDNNITRKAPDDYILTEGHTKYFELASNTKISGSIPTITTTPSAGISSISTAISYSSKDHYQHQPEIHLKTSGNHSGTSDNETNMDKHSFRNNGSKDGNTTNSNVGSLNENQDTNTLFNSVNQFGNEKSSQEKRRSGKYDDDKESENIMVHNKENEDQGGQVDSGDYMDYEVMEERGNLKSKSKHSYNDSDSTRPVNYTHQNVLPSFSIKHSRLVAGNKSNH